MKMEDILTHLDNYSNKHDVVVFEGFIDGHSNKVVWADTSKVKDYFKLLEKVNVDCIAYFSLDFEIDEDLDNSDIQLILKKPNSKAARLYKKLKAKEGILKTINISGIANGFSYDFFKLDDDLSSEIDELKFLLQELTQKEEEEKYKKLAIQARSEIADKVASNYEYFKNITRPSEIEKLINKALEEYGIEMNELDFRTQWDLKDRIKAKFEKKYKDEHEEEIIKVIKTYKDKKMSKNEIRARLGITKGTLDKYYYL